MAFSVSTLTDYVEEKNGELINATVLGAYTLKNLGVTITPGIKSSQTINILDSNAEFQADTGCSYNTSGTTSVTQRTIAVSKVMVSETLCPEDLEAKYLQYAVQAGSTHEKLPFEKMIIDQKLAYMNRNLEVAIWQGETDHTFNTNLKQFDGWISIIDGASGIVAGNTSSATSITASNILTLIEDMYAVVPSKILGNPNLVCLMGQDNFRLFTIAMRRANLYHYDAENNRQEMYFPGTNMKVKAVPGLNADNDSNLPVAYKNRMYILDPENLVYGTDMANEEEKFMVWFSQDDQNIKSLARFKAGCQIKRPTEIVHYKNA